VRIVHRGSSLVVTFEDIRCPVRFVYASRRLYISGVGQFTSLTIGASPGGRLLNYSVHELRPHPSYARHKLSVQTSQLAALEEDGEFAFQRPIVITAESFIIDGYARWELAKRQGRATLPCLEYDITEHEGLELLIQTHRRSQGNDFRRIELALDREQHFKDQALLNRRQGGRLKALSTLTEAGKVDSRRAIARLAHVSVGNVHKVKYILAHSCSALKEAASIGEISINLAEKWSHLPEAEQCENLRQNRIKRGIRKKARNLIARHAAVLGKSQPEQQVIRLADFARLIHHLNAIASAEPSDLGSIEVKFVKDSGRTVFVSEDLLSELGIQQIAAKT